MIRNSDAEVVDASDTKRNTSDRVTACDRAVEDMVARTIAKRYPSHVFLGEETFKTGQVLTDAPTFVCDPIDGTLNFIHGFPNCAVSLALTINKEPVVGVVYNPGRDDMFSAIKGHGAFLRRGADAKAQRLPLRAPAPLGSLNDALVAVEWGNQRSGPNWDLRSDVAMRLLAAQSEGGAMVHSIRSSGSAALDFCYVGAGWMDAFWEGGCWIWDVCAGWLIVQEAGGIVVGANPEEWDASLEGRSYFCVRGAETHEQHAIVNGVWDLMEGCRFQF
jgi:myo-inositol-1(or 4)-monophosphatase